MKIFVFIAIMAVIVGGIAVMSNHAGNNMERSVSSVIMQGFDRGYQCAKDNRDLEDCKTEQRKRWGAAK